MKLGIAGRMLGHLVAVVALAATASVVGLASDAPAAFAEGEPTATVLSLTTSNENPHEEESVTYTATVSPAPGNGVIVFYEDGRGICGPQEPVAGVVTCTAPLKHEGGVSILAEYIDSETEEWGESHNEIEVIGALSLKQVEEDEAFEKAEEEKEAKELYESEHSTTTELSASPEEPFNGHSVVYRAVVHATNSETVGTGEVFFYVEGTSIEGCDPALVYSGVATCEVPEAPGGRYSGPRLAPYHVQAEYSGHDEPFGDSSAGTEVTVREATKPSVTVTAEESKRIGEAVLITAELSALGATGSVEFRDEGEPIAECVEVSVMGGFAKCEAHFSSAGTHTITAKYSGTLEGAYESSSGTGEVTILERETGMTIEPRGLTHVEGGFTGFTAKEHESVKYWAMISQEAATGRVTFYDDGVELQACKEVTVEAHEASCTQEYNAEGLHHITARYSDPTKTYANAESTEIPVLVLEGEQEENEKKTHVLPLSASPEPVEEGEPVTYTAYVKTLAEAPVSGGTVEFEEYGLAIAGCSESPVSGGVATCTTTGGKGTLEHKLQIWSRYSGNGTQLASGEIGVFEVVEGKGGGGESGPTEPTGTHTYIEANPNGPYTNEEVTYRAEVETFGGAHAVGGTVAFSLDGTTIPGCAAQPVSGSGEATCVGAGIPVAGGHLMNASYSGAGSYEPSSGAELLHVEPFGTVEPTFEFSSAPETPVPGESVTYTIHITGEGSHPVGGYLGFEDEERRVAGCEYVPVNAEGVGTCTTTARGPARSHAIYVVFYGWDAFEGHDQVFHSNVAEPESIATTTGLTASSETPPVGTAVEYTATVSPAPSGGTVDFRDGGEEIGCEHQPVVNGTATCTVAYLYTGTRSITAGYSGHGAYESSATESPTAIEVGEPVATETVAETGVGTPTSETATLNAEVNPEGEAVTECIFEYGLTSSYGKTAACAPTPEGSVLESVEAQLTGLTPGTPYHFRIKLVTAGGTAEGSDKTFETFGATTTTTTTSSTTTTTSSTTTTTSSPTTTNSTTTTTSPTTTTSTSPTTTSTTSSAPLPSVSAGLVFSLGETSALLSGVGSAEGSEVIECVFEYGTSNAYGETVPCGVSPEEWESTELTSEITNLTPGTRYYWRLTVITAAGTAHAVGTSFETRGSTTTTTTTSSSSTTSTSPTTTTTSSTTTTSPTMTTTSTSTSATTTTSSTSSSSSTTTTTSSTSSSSSTTTSPTTTTSSTTTTTSGAPLPTVATDPAISVAATAATLTGVVDPHGSPVTECVIEYGISTSYSKSAPCAPAPGEGTSAIAVAAEVEGLTPGTEYDYRVKAKNITGTEYGANVTFKTLLVTTTTTTSLSSTTTTSPTTTTSSSTTTTSPTTTTTSSTTTSTSPPTTTSSTTTTSPTTTTSASSSSSSTTTSSTTSTSSSSTTTTSPTTTTSSTTTTTSSQAKPSATTGAATGVTTTAAHLHAKVTAHGAEVTVCEIEYGTSTSYDKHGPCSPAVGSGTAEVAIELAVEGLAPGTKYDYRVTATNIAGTEYGSNQTFETEPMTTTTTSSSSTTTTSPTTTTTSSTTTTSPTTTTSTSSPTTTSSTTTTSPPTTTTTTTSSAITTPAPELGLLSKGPRPLINARSLGVLATCGPAQCTVMATATVKLPGSARVWHLGVDHVAIAANGQKTLMLTVPYALRQAVRGYLLRHPHYDVTVAVRLMMTQNGHVTQTVTRSLPIWTYVKFR